ncbi:MAG: TAXI family TRAP transporter solute-binding subunit [Alphaproteobacteria bacterium]|nr:TAXI family TRAP transporter solute-binding subunit [Alphaproteobacteria bacterium]
MNRRILMLAGALSAALAIGPAQAQTTLDLKIGAMPLNTWWYVAGGAIANLVQPTLPSGAKIEVLARGGGIANPVVANENKAQIAFTNVATAAWAWMGEEEIYKGKKHQDIRSLVGGINPIWVVAMLREDYIKKTGNDTLEKALADKSLRIIMKPAGSSVPPVARMVLQSHGQSIDTYKQDGRLIQVDAAQTTSMLRDGRADLYFESAPRGHPAVTELTLTVDMRFIDYPQKALDTLARNGLKVVSMPALYKGQNGPTKTVDLGTSILANKNLPDDIAYLVTKTVVENKADLVKAHQAFNDFTPEDAWKPENNGIPLHPGAERYYKERGWIKTTQ